MAHHPTLLQERDNNVALCYVEMLRAFGRGFNDPMQITSYDRDLCVEAEKNLVTYFSPLRLLDDPWMAAHQFLERNDLSQMFLDQVVDFILKNTKGVTIGQQASSASDPFTGK